MNPNGLTVGLFFTLSEKGKTKDTVYVTNAVEEVFNLHYKASESFEEFKRRMNRDGYRVDKFDPPHQLRF